MVLRRYAMGVAIEGVPDEMGESQALFYTGFAPEDAGEWTGLSGYTLERALVERPGEIESSVDMYTGEIELASMSVAVSATDTICRRLLAQRAAEPARAELAEPADADDSTLRILTTEEIPDVIWIGDEALTVGLVQDTGDNIWRVGVDRGAFDTDELAYGAGERVYLAQPYLHMRRLQLVGLDHLTRQASVMWEGFIDGFRTDAQQTEIVLSSAEIIHAIWGVDGGSTVTTPAPRWEATADRGGDLRGPVADLGLIPARTGSEAVNVRVDEAAFRVDIDSETGLVEPRSSAIFQTLPDVDEGWESMEGEEVQVFLGWSSVPEDGTLLSQDLAGVYGVDPDRGAHAAAVALSLLLSTGEQRNDLELGGTTYTFDVSNPDFGLGVPARLIEAESWIRAIDEVDAYLDRVVLGFDDTFSFEEVIVEELLRPYGLYPRRSWDGRVGIASLDDWTVRDSLFGVAGDTDQLIAPDSIRLDWRVEEFSSVVKGEIGGALPDEDLDKERWRATQGLRKDRAIGQSPHQVRFPYADKGRFRDDRAGINERIDDMLAVRRENPPFFEVIMPRESGASLGSYGRRLPPLLSWVRITNGPETSLIGPGGERIKAEDATDQQLAGRLVGTTWDPDTGDVEATLWMQSWRLTALPRLIAPSARIDAHDSSGDTIDITDDFEAADVDESVPQNGFSPDTAERARVIHADGRPWYGEEDLEVTAGEGASWQELTVEVGTIAEDIGAGDDLIVVLADADDYTPAWDRRPFAFIADAAGQLVGPDGPLDADIWL